MSELSLRTFLWERSGKNILGLPVGGKRRELLKFLALIKEVPAPVDEFQTHLKKYTYLDQWITRLQRKLDPITSKNYFEKLISLIGLANPVSFLPQLSLLIKERMISGNVNGVSVTMFFIFLLINCSFFMLWVKQRNKGMLISTTLTICIIIAISYSV